jgi:uncharacterized membrane protein
VSILLNVIGVILLYVFLILPHWYFGLSRRPQLIMEISLVMMVISQIFVAIVWSKKFKGSVLAGSMPISFKQNTFKSLISLVVSAT